MKIEPFFDEATWTVSYVVACTQTGAAAIIDPVLDFNPNAGRTTPASAQKLIDYIRATGLRLTWILETHAHADHLSGAAYIKAALGGDIVIGANISKVQDTFAKIYNLGPAFPTDGSQFDKLVSDGGTLALGNLKINVLHTPGHTPACVTYVIGDAAFVGDTMFMPDYGTARTDFPGGDAATLYRSIRRVLDLPPTTRLFMCHDYKAPGRDVYAWETTVAAQRKFNVHAHDGISEAEFVAMRTARDKTLDMPRLLLPAIQVNIRAGHLPEPEANGVSYLKLPVNAV
ncbi:MAG: MBL fold metallo-hydrolase [Rhodospirillaceae bacterium]|nr:MBL fold metallo-hydrolase [Rhodospirillaceae bacterium]